MPDVKKREDIIVSYVKSPSKWGEDLFRRTKELLEGLTPYQNKTTGEWYDIQVIDVVNQNWNGKKANTIAECQFLAANLCFCSDVLIFDASIEDSEASQYRFAYEPMRNLDYVLIVSRTDVPYNFEGRRKGGAPSWIRIGEEDKKLETNPKRRNDQILDWLRAAFHGEKLSPSFNFADAPLELPRSDKLSEPLNIQNCFEVPMRTNKNSDARMKGAEEPSLFISYLSRDYLSLKAVFNEIERKTGVPSSNFRYFAPGKVADELMTEERRWEIVSVTDREMDRAGTLVIFETEGYYRSWWTTGERMSVSYRYHHNWEKCPRVYIARLQKNNVLEWEELKTAKQKQDFFPAINEKQMRELAQRFAYSDPHEASYEKNDILARQAEAPAAVKFLRGIVKGTSMFLLEKMGVMDEFQTGDEEEPWEKGTLRDNISHAIASENALPRRREFWTKRIVECPYCRESDPPLTLDNFINLDMKYVYRVEDEELREDAEGFLTLASRCGKHEIMKFKKNGGYFRFIQPRGGRIMRDKKMLVEYIERIDCVKDKLL